MKWKWILCALLAFALLQIIVGLMEIRNFAA